MEMIQVETKRPEVTASAYETAAKALAVLQAQGLSPEAQSMLSALGSVVEGYKKMLSRPVTTCGGKWTREGLAGSVDFRGHTQIFDDKLNFNFDGAKAVGWKWLLLALRLYCGFTRDEVSEKMSSKSTSYLSMLEGCNKKIVQSASIFKLDRILSIYDITLDEYFYLLRIVCDANYDPACCGLFRPAFRSWVKGFFEWILIYASNNGYLSNNLSTRLGK